MAATISFDTINLTHAPKNYAPGYAWTVEEAYTYCRGITVSHYENFPVGSILIPRHLRPHVYAIYSFARVSDDFADEAEYKDKENRLALLNNWQQQLEDCYQGKADHPIFIALANTVKQCEMPIDLFSGLLHAFKRDVLVSRYQTFDEVIQDYCQYSANPVGRLILHLFGYRDEELFTLSDHICTALQLTNFWQDVEIDLRKDRIYIPQENMRRLGYSEEKLFQHNYNEAFCTVMKELVSKTWDLFEKGYPLLEKVKFPLSAELRFTWLGGVSILSRTKEIQYDVFNRRPKLHKTDFLWLGLRSFGSIRAIVNQKRDFFTGLS